MAGSCDAKTASTASNFNVWRGDLAPLPLQLPSPCSARPVWLASKQQAADRLEKHALPALCAASRHSILKPAKPATPPTLKAAPTDSELLVSHQPAPAATLSWMQLSRWPHQLGCHGRHPADLGAQTPSSRAARQVPRINRNRSNSPQPTSM